VRRIAVVGLGRLGSPIAACLASKGFQLVGADIDAEKVDALNRGIAPVNEMGLQELLDTVDLMATTDIREAVAASEATFVVVPTPSDEGGGFSVEHMVSACREIAAGFDGYHLVSLVSTVMPGSTEGPIRSALEEASGGKEFGLCYNPSFIALGSVIENFLEPEFILIGESEPVAGGVLSSQIYAWFTSAPIVRMSTVNAELTKLALNAFVTMKISFANMLARACERLPGGDVDQVTGALALDGRIGGKYLKGAIGYGGPCFPRDNAALTRLLSDLKLPGLIPEAAHGVNRWHTPYLVELVKKARGPAGRVGILGLSYKVDTDVTEESQALLLAKVLLEDGVPLIAHDPMAMGNARRELPGLRLAQSAAELVSLADVVVVAVPWPEFRGLSYKGKTVIDCWRIVPGEHIDLGREMR